MTRYQNSNYSLFLFVIVAFFLAVGATAEANSQVAQREGVLSPAMEATTTAPVKITAKSDEAEVADLLEELFAEPTLLTGCGCSTNNDCNQGCIDGGVCVRGQCICSIGTCVGSGGSGSGNPPPPPQQCPFGPTCTTFGTACVAFCHTLDGVCIGGCCLC